MLSTFQRKLCWPIMILYGNCPTSASHTDPLVASFLPSEDHVPAIISPRFSPFWWAMGLGDSVLICWRSPTQPSCSISVPVSFLSFISYFWVKLCHVSKLSNRVWWNTWQLSAAVKGGNSVGHLRKNRHLKARQGKGSQGGQSGSNSGFYLYLSCNVLQRRVSDNH